MSEQPRSCVNCGAPERRWTEHGREHVNLSPLTNQCVACLIGYTKETNETRAQQGLEFDARAAAARNDA